MAQPGKVTVEFFGIPRLRAGRAELDVPGGTVGEVLVAVERACPDLARIVDKGRLAPHYLLSLNGESFNPDLTQALYPGDRLLLLSADAGG